ncbi:MAG: DUF1344 domain-containing protein [Alphaproteobacteria bacterium]|nr:DUF1344 domain-containing protein [Alphaproteobacteria bacterium]
MKKTLFAAALMLPALLSVNTAFAADANGTVRSYDATQRIVTLDDGRMFYLSGELPRTSLQALNDVQPGSKLAIAYAVTAGLNVVTSVGAPATTIAAATVAPAK